MGWFLSVWLFCRDMLDEEIHVLEQCYGSQA